MTKLLPAALLLAFFLTGCASLSDQKYEMSTKHRASHCYHKSKAGKGRSVHYGEGWKKGYAAILQGASGAVPAVPPHKYWSSHYQNAKGQQRIQDWFAGYQDGVCCAKSGGLDRLAKIPSSGHIGSIPDPYFCSNADCNGCNFCQESVIHETPIYQDYSTVPMEPLMESTPADEAPSTTDSQSTTPKVPSPPRLGPSDSTGEGGGGSDAPRSQEDSQKTTRRSSSVPYANATPVPQSNHTNATIDDLLKADPALRGLTRSDVQRSPISLYNPPPVTEAQNSVDPPRRLRTFDITPQAQAGNGYESNQGSPGLKAETIGPQTGSEFKSKFAPIRPATPPVFN